MEGFLLFILAVAAAIYLHREYQKNKTAKANEQWKRDTTLRFLQKDFYATWSNDEWEHLRTLSSDEMIPTARSYIEQQPGVTLGDESQTLFSTYNEESISLPIVLPENLRTHHLYVVGKTGSRKTTLLLNLIKQDLDSGAGLAVIAPEAEMLTEQIIPMIPDHRQDDLIYVDPGDTERPVPFNPLKKARKESLDLKVGEATTIFARVVGDTTPRMARIVSNTFHALIEKDGTTLLDVERLLDPLDPTFRQHICKTTKDPRLRHFFENVYPTFPKDACQPINNRIDALIRSQVTRRFLCNPDKSLNFRLAMDTGKIMLFNLSDGLFKEDDASLIGQLIISKLQASAMSRADTPAKDRKRFYIYVDEFQTFTTVSARAYELLLSRARKYEIGLILAHQHTDQIPLPLLKGILGNVGSIVVLQVGSDDARRLSREFLLPTPDKYGLETEMKTPDPNALQQQPKGMAHARIETHSFRLNGRPPPPTDQSRTNYLIERSRQLYGRPVPTPDVLHTNDQTHDDEFSHTWDDD